MDFFKKAGKLALGSRLKILSEKMLTDAAEVYKVYEVPIQPKWFPIFYILAEEGQMAVTDIAKSIGHSHPSVSKTVREMAKHGIVTESKDKKDKRKNLVGLSQKAKAMRPNAEIQFADVNETVESMIAQSNHDIWKALDELEYLLEEKSLFKRVMATKKSREAKDVKIVPYTPKYRKVFKTLNEEWIDQYFKLEDEDRKLLDNPKKNILNKGGHIFIALYKGEAIGTCALVPIDDPEYDFELGKMGVSPKAQGKGVGWLLGQAVVEKAKELGCKKLYLESNTVLEPAIKLYLKMGFKKVVGHPSPYARCNIQMGMDLEE